MAASSGRKSSSSKSNRKSTKSTSGKKTGARTSAAKSGGKKGKAAEAARERALYQEIGLIALFAVMLLLFCCNFGLIGPVGNTVSGVLFGLFGWMAYAAPVLIFLGVAFYFANEGNPNVIRKLTAGVVLFFMLGILCDLFAADWRGKEYSAGVLYETCRDTKAGGGILAGSLSFFLQQYLEIIGTVLVVLLCSVVSIILLTEKSLLSSVKKGGSRMREQARIHRQEQEELARERRLKTEERRKEQEDLKERKARERRLKAEEKENEKILRMEKKVSGVMLDTALPRTGEAVRRDDMHEIILEEEDAAAETFAQEQDITEESGKNEALSEDWKKDEEDLAVHAVHEIHPIMMDEFDSEPNAGADIRIHKEGSGTAKEEIRERKAPSEREAEKLQEEPSRGMKAVASLQDAAAEEPVMEGQAAAAGSVPKQYMFPPISILQKGKAAAGDSARELKETAVRLQQTLSTFGVRVTITDISQGPSVTRYELQPEQGVKVSKIVGLSDDIKLNLAATDIRIEAPIPGKAAVGIEVPNKENMPVALRDLLETKEFDEFPSNLAFAVGKDIAGKVVVSDIAKMPHMLIAGATGSGKSVCINTLIMSILYKAHPNDVKLIMVDPKVVELSVYNGIPHLLIPVVTDPKKASAALQWGVAEMDHRYKQFAEYNVRNLKEFNKKMEKSQTGPKLPQIVIIVDELADLMMVCPGEVETAICRLAQLARAAGIHLIIATQRPSVDVITGLIKANMPSRVAFSVSSGVDSRTILDMVGAERLLGKGDMLFYPQGYSKPARVQGAFVSDQEVSDVVDFLKNQVLGNVYAEDVEEKLKHLESSGSGGMVSGGSEVDELFEKAGRLIIDKDKASIGMLQRALQIGFNRAARIMDQLCQYGVVGEEEGTKPRKILMSPEQFETLLEEVG